MTEFHSPQPEKELSPAEQLGVKDGEFQVKRFVKEPDPDNPGKEKVVSSYFESGWSVEGIENGKVTLIKEEGDEVLAKYIDTATFADWQAVEEDPADVTIPNDRLRKLQTELETSGEKLEAAPAIVRDAVEVALDGVVETPDDETEQGEDEKKPEVDINIEAAIQALQQKAIDTERVISELEQQAAAIQKSIERHIDQGADEIRQVKNRARNTLSNLKDATNQTLRQAASGDYPHASLVTLSERFAESVFQGRRAITQNLASNSEEVVRSTQKRIEHTVLEVQAAQGIADRQIVDLEAAIYAIGEKTVSQKESQDVNQAIKTLTELQERRDAVRRRIVGSTEPYQNRAELKGVLKISDRSVDDLDQSFAAMCSDISYLADEVRREGRKPAELLVDIITKTQRDLQQIEQKIV